MGRHFRANGNPQRAKPKRKGNRPSYILLHHRWVWLAGFLLAASQPCAAGAINQRSKLAFKTAQQNSRLL